MISMLHELFKDRKDESMQLAPVALFVYNRLWHTMQTVEALKKNELAGDSLLFVFSDGPRSGGDAKKIEELRQYLKSVTGFKKIVVREREQNVGLAQSIISGVTEIVGSYGRIVVLEDDMVSSPFFLTYMHDALEFYENVHDVVSIHGYLFPVKRPMPDTFFLKGADCWGWATWKRGWDVFEQDGRRLLAAIHERGLERSFDFDGAYPYTKMLRDQIEGKNNSWAIRWYASAFLKGKLTLYPGISLVQNIGNDSSGTHSGKTDAFFTKVSETKVNVAAIPVMEHQFARGEVSSFLRSLRPGLMKRVVNKLAGTFKGVSL